MAGTQSTQHGHHTSCCRGWRRHKPHNMDITPRVDWDGGDTVNHTTWTSDFLLQGMAGTQTTQHGHHTSCCRRWLGHKQYNMDIRLPVAGDGWDINNRTWTSHLLLPAMAGTQTTQHGHHTSCCWGWLGHKQHNKDITPPVDWGGWDTNHTTWTSHLVLTGMAETQLTTQHGHHTSC